MMKLFLNSSSEKGGGDILYVQHLVSSQKRVFVQAAGHFLLK